MVALVSVFAFEAMAVATAMPIVAADLDGIGLYGLAFGAPLAASVVGMVFAGIAVDRRGTRGPFLLSAIVFTVGLLLAGLATTMSTVVVGRAVQGLGTGAAIVALYVVVDTYPVPLQKKMFAAFAAAWIVPALVGPAIAGFLAEQVHWRAVFLLVAVAMPLAAAVIHGRLVTRVDDTSWSAAERGRFGAATSAATGVVLLHVGGHREDVVGAILLLVGFVAVFTSTRHLLPPGALTLARGLPAVVAMRGLAAAAFMAAEVFIPLLLTTTRGFSATSAGLVLTVGALGWSAGSWVQGRYDAPAPRWVGTGMLAMALGVTLVALTTFPAVPSLTAAVGWTLSGFGMGLAIPTLSVQLLALSTPGTQGRNVSSLQVADAAAGATALAVTGSLLAHWGTRNGVFGGGLALSVVIALVAAALASRVEA